MLRFAAIAFEAPTSDRMGPSSSFETWSFWITVSVLALFVVANMVMIWREWRRQ